jgi:hypothetical protein
VAARRLTFQVRVTWFFYGRASYAPTPTWQYSQVQVSEEPLICSARGCRNPAVHALRWNNPKLHTPDRRKTWLACDAHLTSLGDFLRARQFLREVEPVAAG